MVFRKRILLALVFSFCFNFSKAQFVTIPDTNFVNWLNNNGYASCLTGSQLDISCSVVQNATGLDCSGSGILDLSGIEYFPNLLYLVCNNNPNINISSFPNTLKELDCSNSNIWNLPTFPVTLEKFYGYINHLFSIPVSIPSNLKEVWVGYNDITQIGFVGNSLEYLDCSNNDIDLVTSLPVSLKTFYCDNNLLTSLPQLPDSLLNLTCSYNSITSIPNLPSKLKYLYCDNNVLTTLPKMPESLTYFYGHGNYFYTFPVISKSLKTILCSGCQINDFSNLNDTMVELDIRGNSGLKCLPFMKQIGILRWANTGISCLADSLVVVNAIPSIQNLPLCNWNNVNNCAVARTINGSVYSDQNANCQLDSAELMHSFVKVNLLSSGTVVQQTYSNSNGQFYFGTNAGNFTVEVDTVLSQYDVTCPLSFKYSMLIDSLFPFNNNIDFSIECKPVFDLAVTSILSDSGFIRPAGFARIKVFAGGAINSNNLNCVNGVSGFLKVVLQGPVNFIAPSPNAMTPLISGDTLIYTVADFGSINTNEAFKFIIQVDTSILQFQQVCFSVFIEVLPGDFNISNNNLLNCFNILNSFDPNDKLVFPSLQIDTSQSWLTYTIRFQNTGNAPAIFVSVLDTLDQNLDESSFQLLSFSHIPDVQIEGKKIRFDFNNINLPDSLNDEPNSHGYIQFHIKRKTNLAIGSIIQNTAYIYFDYNIPVKTNTTINVIEDFSDYVLIPDSNFAFWLKSHGFSDYMFGNLLDTSFSLVKNLIKMDCSSFNISDLTGIKYFKKLDTLNCSSNTLVSLPLLPPIIRYVNCNANSINSIFSFPPSLKNFDCSYNQLLSLPTLPNGLTNMNCSYNLLQTLPSLPNGLTYLNCSSNLLQSIPVIPNGLANVNCSFNLLQTLPTLPNGLTDFNCSENQIVALPQIPSTLKYLDCHANQISAFSNVPNTLKQIYIHDNQLASIGNLPDTMTNLNISNNPTLNCLPKFMKITGNFNWSGTGINCMPNILNAAFANPSLNGVSVCNYFNSNNCIPYPNLKGITYSDANANCIYNVNKNRFENVKINLIKAGVVVDQTYSDSNGNYSFIANDLGSYFNEVDTFNLPFRVNCPTTFRYLSNLTFWNPFFENRDFSLYCKPGFDVGVNSIHRDSGIFMAGTIGQVSVVAGDLSKKFNLNCATGVSGSVKVILSGPVLFTSPSAGAMVPVVNGDTLIYTVANFWNVDINTAFNFLVQTAPSALLGDQICFSVFVSPTSGDSYFENNSYSHCFPVVNSMLSNVKEVSPTNQVDTSEYWLTYTINYQNVSGSLAQNMHIMDTLDLQLNKNTFELVGHSHPVQVQVRSNRILFYYSNINLPDSSVDQETSRGFIQYKVKRYNNLPIGTQIHNTAYIYFDFNAPVQTNTTINEIGLTSGVGIGESQNPILFSIFPNPLASDQMLNIYFNSSEKKKAELNVYDLSGRKLFTQFVNASEQSQVVALPNISPGVYLVMLNVGKHQAQQKLVVLKNSN